jgi:hypothetical protein
LDRRSELAGMSALGAPTTQHWADLPRDLLADISDRLHDIVDFVRFHAICRPWRDLQLAPLSSYSPNVPTMAARVVQKA